MTTTLRAEFYFDGDVGNWHFRVPALHIVGGGTATREEAEYGCLAAIEYALEGDPGEFDDASDAVSLTVSVVPAA